jgi:hypothetical protein
MLVRGPRPIGCCGQELKRSLEDLGDHKPLRSTRDYQFASQIIIAKRDLARSGSVRGGDLDGALGTSRTRSNGTRSEVAEIRRNGQRRRHTGSSSRCTGRASDREGADRIETTLPLYSGVTRAG